MSPDKSRESSKDDKIRARNHHARLPSPSRGHNHAHNHQHDHDGHDHHEVILETEEEDNLADAFAVSDDDTFSESSNVSETSLDSNGNKKVMSPDD